VFSRPLLLELTAVVARPGFMPRAPSWSTDAAASLALIDREPLVAIAGVLARLPRSEGRRRYRNRAPGRVEYLVTGDQDLLDAHVAVTLNAHGILLTTARALVAKVA
jgi:hypothetical protein